MGASLLAIVRPWPLKVLFDFVLLDEEANGRWRPLAEWVGGAPGPATWIVGATVVLIAGLTVALRDVERLRVTTSAHRMVFKLRCRLFAHLHRLSLDFHDASQTGDLLMRLTGDVRLRLHRGTCEVKGVRSPYSIYSKGLAAPGTEGDVFSHRSVEGYTQTLTQEQKSGQRRTGKHHR